MISTPVLNDRLRNYLRDEFVLPGCVLAYPGLDYDNWYTGTIKDYSGQGNDGTIHGATGVRNSKGLWGLSFDGLDDYVNCGKDASLALTTGITVGCWFKQGTPIDNPARLIMKANGGGGSVDNAGYIVSVSNAGGVTFDIAPSGAWNPWNSLSENTTNGIWNLVIGTYDNDYQKLYVNGSLTDSNQVGAGQLADRADADLTIGSGGWNDGAPTQYDFSGLIALPIVFNWAFSASLVTSIYFNERHFFGV